MGQVEVFKASEYVLCIQQNIDTDKQKYYLPLLFKSSHLRFWINLLQLFHYDSKILSNNLCIPTYNRFQNSIMNEDVLFLQNEKERLENRQIEEKLLCSKDRIFKVAVSFVLKKAVL